MSVLTRNTILGIIFAVVLFSWGYQAWRMANHGQSFHASRFQSHVGHDATNFFDSWLLLKAMKHAKANVWTDFSSYVAEVEHELMQGNYQSEGKPAYLALRTGTLWLFTTPVFNEGLSSNPTSTENFAAFRAEYFIYLGYFIAISLLVWGIGSHFFSPAVGMAGLLLTALSTNIVFNIHFKYYVLPSILFLLLAVWFLFRALEKKNDLVFMLLGSLFVALCLMSHPRFILVIGFLWCAFLYGLHGITARPFRIYPYLRGSLLFWSVWLVFVMLSAIHQSVIQLSPLVDANAPIVRIKPWDDWVFYYDIFRQIFIKQEPTWTYRWLTFPLDYVRYTDGPWMMLLLLAGSLYGIGRLWGMIKSPNILSPQEKTRTALLLFFVLLGWGYPMVSQGVVELKNYGDFLYNNRNYAIPFIAWIILASGLLGNVCTLWPYMKTWQKGLFSLTCLLFVCFQAITFDYMHDILYAESRILEESQGIRTANFPFMKKVTKNVMDIPDQILNEYDFVSLHSLLHYSEEVLPPTFLLGNFKLLNNWILVGPGMISDSLIRRPYMGPYRKFIYSTKYLQEIRAGKNPSWLDEACLRHFLKCINWRVADFATMSWNPPILSPSSRLFINMDKI